MLDKIMEMVGGDALNEITSKAGISMDQAKQMMPLAQESLQEGLMSQVTGGNTEGLLGMFNSATGGGGGLMSNGIFGSIKGMFMKKIMTNMGIPESVAGLAAGAGMSSMIGNITGMLQQDGDNDDINVSNIMNVLGGGGAAGMLGGLLGGEAGGALGGLKDAAAGLMGGAKDTADGAGGLAEDVKDAAVDKLKDIAGGLFGK